MNTICIMCPMGCPLTIEEVNGEVVVSGNTCKRGAMYGKEEYTHPKRCVTTLVEMKSGGVASCKTSATIPKERIFDVMKEISKVQVIEPLGTGDIVIENVLGLGVDVVITSDLMKGEV